MLTNDGIGSRRFLFVLWDGGGNVPPQLAVARQLVARGHQVRVLAPRTLATRITAVGAEFVPYRRAPEHDSHVPERDLIQDWTARTPLGAAAQFRDHVLVGSALAFAQDVLDALDEQPSDVVVPDYALLGAYLGAERAALPTAALIHHIYPLPAPGLPPFGMGFQPARGPVGHLRDAIFHRLFVRFYNAGLPQINAARADLGLEPLSSVFALFARLDRALVLTSPAFDFPADELPSNVRYVGPQLDDSAAGPMWSGPWADGDERPLVVGSLSTTFQGQGKILRRVIDALAALPVRALVTTGPALDPADFPAPPHIAVESYVPHRQVFPQAAVVVTHGGHGTVLTALAHGVPVLCLPMGRDQGDVAARVVSRGVGLRLGDGAKPDTIRQAIQRLLQEPHFREGAHRLADILTDEQRASRVVAEIEALAGTESAVPTTAR